MTRYFWVRSDGEIRELQPHQTYTHLMNKRHLVVMISKGKKMTEIGLNKQCTIWIRLDQLETILKTIKGDVSNDSEETEA